MNSILEKEKKLNIAIAKLKNLNLEDPDIKKNIEILGEQKNQLQIEKSEIENRKSKKKNRKTRQRCGWQRCID